MRNYSTPKFLRFKWVKKSIPTLGETDFSMVVPCACFVLYDTLFGVNQVLTMKVGERKLSLNAHRSNVVYSKKN